MYLLYSWTGRQESYHMLSFCCALLLSAPSPHQYLPACPVKKISHDNFAGLRLLSPSYSVDRLLINPLFGNTCVALMSAAPCCNIYQLKQPLHRERCRLSAQQLSSQPRVYIPPIKPQSAITFPTKNTFPPSLNSQMKLNTYQARGLYGHITKPRVHTGISSS